MAPRGLLLTGTSHAGKSTLAAGLADTLGWPIVATDKLGRHPGRPWPAPPAPVDQFYDRLDPDSIHWFLRVHHQNMAPGLQRRIAEAAAPAILEGAALRPEIFAPHLPQGWRACCLTAPDAVLTQRIHSASAYAAQAPRRQRILDAFLDRSLRENAALTAAAAQAGMLVIDTSTTDPQPVVLDLLGGP